MAMMIITTVKQMIMVTIMIKEQVSMLSLQTCKTSFSRSALQNFPAMG